MYGIWWARNKICYEGKHINKEVNLVVASNDEDLGFGGFGDTMQNDEGNVLTLEIWISPYLDDSSIKKGFELRLWLRYVRQRVLLKLKVEADPREVFNLMDTCDAIL